jgi:hypothetical protein
VIKFASELRQVGAFLRVHRFNTSSNLRQVGAFLRVHRFNASSNLIATIKLKDGVDHPYP